MFILDNLILTSAKSAFLQGILRHWILSDERIPRHNTGKYNEWLKGPVSRNIKILT